MSSKCFNVTWNERNRYLKKGDSTYLCKGKFLVQVGQDKQDIKLIPFPYTEKIVNTEKLKWMGETMKKPEVIQGCNKFVWGMNSADQMFHYCWCFITAMKLNSHLVLFLLHISALNKVCIVQKIYDKPISKGQGLCFEGPHIWLCLENDKSQQREKMRMIVQMKNHKP
jgi:hypothetical protein